MNGWTSGDTLTKCIPLSCLSHRFAVMDFWSFPVLICCFHPGVCSGSFSSCPCCISHALVLISFTCPWFPSCVYSLCLPRSLQLPAPLRSSPVSYQLITSCLFRSLSLPQIDCFRDSEPLRSMICFCSNLLIKLGFNLTLNEKFGQTK